MFLERIRVNFEVKSFCPRSDANGEQAASSPLARADPELSVNGEGTLTHALALAPLASICLRADAWQFG